MMNVYGVIMAGGGGTRFWPLSRRKNPKQLLNLTGKNLMINETIDRIARVIPTDNIFIVTNEEQALKMKTAVEGRIKDSHILAEPAARNTAACIGYAAEEIMKKYGDGIMCVFPSDHYIKNEDRFADVLREAISEADKSSGLVTIGIEPTYASTGYGYIRYDKNEMSVSKCVLEFKEKPDLKTAEQYVESGEYAWNSGMFIWKTGVILNKFKELLPDIYDFLEKIGEHIGKEDEKSVITELYPQIPSISIDYGIMEKSDNVRVIPAEFGWNDVGSWDNLGALYESDDNGNIVVSDNYINIDSENCIIYGQKKLIATINVQDLIVVETPDAIMICNKNNAQDVKKVTDILKSEKMDNYL